MQSRYAVFSTSLWLFTACANLFGGQSGDDGDVIDRGGGPTADPDPEDPDDDCTEPRELEATSPTSFGKTPTELIAELISVSVPLHWVAYASQQFDVSYAPGPSDTKLVLSFSLRENLKAVASEDAIIERVPTVEAAMNQDCGGARVEAPIWLDLQSRDGALNERVEGTVVFYGNAVAEVFATLSVEALDGTLEFGAATSNPNNEQWKPSTLTLNADLWPGGSAGAIYPEFVRASTSEGGSEATSPPPATPPSRVDVGAAPVVPDQWNAIAVWPRLEQCSPGVARTSLDPVVGVSAQTVIDTLTSHPLRALTIATNATALTSTQLAVDIELSALPDLLCVSVDHRRRQLTFSIPAALQGTGDGDTPAVVDASFDLTLTAQTDNLSLTNVHFLRTLSETAYPIPKTELSETTGLSLEGLSDDYSEFWWTWYGNLALETPTNSTTYDAHLVVASPGSRERAEIAAQPASGGPGFGVAYDNKSVQLPGEVVFHAEFAE